MIPVHIRESAVTYLLLAGCILAFILQGFPVDTPDALSLIQKGANFTPLSTGTETWRIFTSIFLHGGILHLILNMTALYILGSSMETQTGHAYLFLLFIFSGLWANIISMQFNFFTVSVGASGAIFGLFGFHAAKELWDNRQNLALFLRTLLLLCIYLLITTLLGSVLPFDNAAHLGGFCFGLAIAVLSIVHPFFQKSMGLLIIAPLIFIAFSLIPDTQKIHFNQFQSLMGLASERTEFTSDMQAAEAYSLLMKTYDSLGQVFSDSLPLMNAELAADRYALSEYADMKSEEAQYMAELIYQETYRYLDSLEIIRRYVLPELNYPLALEYGSPTPVPDKSSPNQLERVFYDSAWREIPRREKAVYYRIGYKDSLNRWDGLVEDYYIDGAIQMKGSYTAGLRDGIFRYYFQDSTYDAVGRYDREYRVGKWEFFHEDGDLSQIYVYGDRAYLQKSWDRMGNLQVTDGDGAETIYYTNGNIRSFTPFKDGLREGRAYGLYSDGKIKYQERFENGRLVIGESYKGSNTITYDASSLYPTPVTGMESFRTYIDQKKRENQIGDERATVRLLFSCSPQGEIYDIRILDSYTPYYDQLAIQWLKNGPHWNPARDHGRVAVTSEGVVAIDF